MNFKEMSLTDLLKAREEAQKLAATNTTNWDRRTITGMEGMKKKKKEEVAQIDDVLVGKILSNSVAILLMRDVTNADQIIETARAKSKSVLAFDELGVENELVNKIYATSNNSKGYMFNTDALNKLNILAVQYWDQLLATSVPTVYGSASMYGMAANKKDAALKIEKVLFTAYGTGLKVPLYRKHLLDSVKSYLNTPSLLVFYKNVSKEFVKGFSSYAGKSVVVTEDPKAVGSVIITKDTAPEEFVDLLLQVNNS